MAYAYRVLQLMDLHTAGDEADPGGERLREGAKLITLGLDGALKHETVFPGGVAWTPRS